MMGVMVRKAAQFALFKQKDFLSLLYKHVSWNFPCLSDWLMLVKIQRRVGFGHVGPLVPVWFASPDWVRLPVIFSMQNVRYIISATISAQFSLKSFDSCRDVFTS